MLEGSLCSIVVKVLPWFMVRRPRPPAMPRRSVDLLGLVGAVVFLVPERETRG